MRLASRALAAGGLGFAASLLVACGGGAGLLSGNDASTLSSRLDSVSSAVAAGHCAGAEQAVAAFSNYVSNLPSSVNLGLRKNLLQGASTVAVLAQRDCTTTTRQSSTSTTSTSSTTTAPTTTSTTSTSTTSTTTTTTTTTSTPATSTPSTSTTSTSGGAGVGGGASGGGNGANSGSGGSG